MVFTFPYLAKSIPMECRLPVETSILAAASLGTGCSHLSLVLSQVQVYTLICALLHEPETNHDSSYCTPHSPTPGRAVPIFLGTCPITMSPLQTATVKGSKRLPSSRLHGNFINNSTPHVFINVISPHHSFYLKRCHFSSALRVRRKNS